MKKLFALLLCCALLLCFAGCAPMEYQEALEIYNAGDYASALNRFTALGDYADSQAMAQVCAQRVNYANAEAAYAAGEYKKALALYEGLGMYQDSPVKAIDCQHEIGLDCLESGAYAEAITWLEPLGNYEGSQQSVLDAKWLWLHDALVSKGGVVQQKTDNGTVYLRAMSDGSFVIAWDNQGYVLGTPFENHLSMTVLQNQREAAYSALYTSATTSQIREEVTGRIDLTQFRADAKLSIDSFCQTKTEPDGTEVLSSETTDALMMPSVLADGQAAIAQCLPLLLAQVDVDITLAEMGFAAL